MKNTISHPPKNKIDKIQSSLWAKKQTNGIVNTFACPIMLDGDLFSL